MGTLPLMTNLTDMLDALDTALSDEEELAIQKPLFTVFPGERRDSGWNSIVQKCDRLLAKLEASVFDEDNPLD
jgi:hypothetical protein